jgi:hypothetical protein
MVNFKSLAVLVAAILPVFGAPLQQEAKRDGPEIKTIPNSYIITLKEGVTARDLDRHYGWVNDIHERSLGRRELQGVQKTYSFDGFRGYAGSFDDATIDMIKASPTVREDA